MKSKTSLLLLFALYFGIAYGQANTIKPLKIGDKVPDILLENVFNYSSKSVRISDFKGKLIILDFWNIACVPCLKGIDKMEHLQQMFGNKIQVLLVNTLNSLPELDRLYVSEENKSLGFPKSSRIPIIRETKLPFVIQPKAFSDLFPHPNEPHHVWIDSNGVVIALTSGWTTNSQKIEDYLFGKTIQMPLHTVPDDLLLSEYHSFLRLENKRILDNIEYSAVIARNLNTANVNGYITDSVTKKLVGWRAGQFPLYLLSLSLPKPFNNPVDMPLDRVILNVKDKRKFIPPKTDDQELLDDWNENHVFNFEIMLPSSKMNGTWEENMELLKRVLRQNLETFFGINTTIQKRKVTCWVLIRCAKKDLKSKGGESIDMAWVYKNKMIIQNCDLFVLLEKFRVANQLDGAGHPLLNGTDLQIGHVLNPVDMEIDAAFNDIEALNHQLQKYGLKIIESNKEVNVLVVTDKINN
jgi:thiol-disulfide isomerase/thioredoxin